jgi:hypothetical protein
MNLITPLLLSTTKYYLKLVKRFSHCLSTRFHRAALTKQMSIHVSANIIHLWRGELCCILTTNRICSTVNDLHSKRTQKYDMETTSRGHLLALLYRRCNPEHSQICNEFLIKNPQVSGFNYSAPRFCRRPQVAVPAIGADC